MTNKRVKINRALVLTSSATVVIERLGIFEEKPEEEKKTSKKAGPKVEPVMLLGRAVPAVRTKDGVRAVAKEAPVTPESVQRYLNQKFGEDLGDVQAAMEELAKA